MRLTKTKLLVILAGLFAIVIGRSRMGAQNAATSTDVIQMLFSEDQAARARAREQLVRVRTALLGQLSTYIGANAHSAKNYWKVKDAMAALGDIKAVESVDLLIEFIGYPIAADVDTSVEIGPTTLFNDGKLPAADALIAIGDQSIDPVIEKLRSTDNSAEIDACIIVLRRMRAPLIRERIKLALQSTIDEREMGRLNSALQSYDNWLPPQERTKRLREQLKQLDPNQ